MLCRLPKEEGGMGVSWDWDMAKILFWDWELLFLFSGILGNDHQWDWDFGRKHTWDWEFLT